MKILFVNEKCGYFGGVEQNIADSAEGLKSRGHECSLAYQSITNKNFESFKSHFNEIFPCRDFGSNTGTNLREIISRTQPDVIYIHKIPDTLPFQPYLSKIRIIRMVHDHDLCCPRRHKYFAINGRVCNYKAGWRCWADGAFIEKCGSSYCFTSISKKLREMRRNFSLDKLIVGSRYMKTELLQNGFPEGKISVLPPMVKMEDHKASPVPDEKNILFVGQLIRGKGVDLMLEALKKVSSPFSAVIVGTGNAEENLKDHCKKLGLSDRVEFTGWAPHEKIGEFYESAKIVVVPSRWPEPFGMIGIEAMKHGRPVVGFNTGGIPDWLHHEVTGLLVPEQNSLAMAKAMEELLTNSSLAAKMGKNANKEFKKKYSFEPYISKLASYFKIDE